MIWVLLLSWFYIRGNREAQQLSDLPMWQWKLLSCVWFFVTPWTMQSMGCSRPEYWSGLPFPSPGDLPNWGIKSMTPALQVDFLPAELQGKPKNTEVGSLPLLQGSSPPRNWTGVSYIAGRFLTNWAIREALRFALSDMPMVGNKWKKMISFNLIYLF